MQKILPMVVTTSRLVDKKEARIGAEALDAVANPHCQSRGHHLVFASQVTREHHPAFVNQIIINPGIHLLQPLRARILHLQVHNLDHARVHGLSGGIHRLIQKMVTVANAVAVMLDVALAPVVREILLAVLVAV